MMVFVPWILWGCALAVVVFGFWRKRRHQPFELGPFVLSGVGVSIAAFDSLVPRFYPYLTQQRSLIILLRMIPALSFIAWLVYTKRFSVKELGFCRPQQGWWYWLKIVVFLGLAGVLLVVLSVWLCQIFDWTWPIEPVDWRWFLLFSFTAYPISEEVTYRIALCAPTQRAIGKWSTIIVCGLIFAALHFVYGNPAPTNFIGGFIFAWAYLKSRSIWVPLLLHSLGNAFVFVVNLVSSQILLLQ